MLACHSLDQAWRRRSRCLPQAHAAGGGSHAATVLRSAAHALHTGPQRHRHVIALLCTFFTAMRSSPTTTGILVTFPTTWSTCWSHITSNHLPHARWEPPRQAGARALTTCVGTASRQRYLSGLGGEQSSCVMTVCSTTRASRAQQMGFWTHRRRYSRRAICKCFNRVSCGHR